MQTDHQKHTKITHRKTVFSEPFQMNEDESKSEKYLSLGFKFQRKRIDLGFSQFYILIDNPVTVIQKDFSTMIK